MILKPKYTVAATARRLFYRLKHHGLVDWKITDGFDSMEDWHNYTFRWMKPIKAYRTKHGIVFITILPGSAPKLRYAGYCWDWSGDPTVILLQELLIAKYKIPLRTIK